MADDTIETAKAALRDRARAVRAAIDHDTRAEAGMQAAASFFDGLAPQHGQVVAGYWPILDEFDCKPILLRLMDSGQPVCLPVTDGDQPLVMRLWAEGEPLYPSGFGTLAPIDSAPVVEPDLIIVPLLGFDKHGTRLGYGKGHYDRTIAIMSKKPRLIGLAFAAQEIDFIPAAQHDVPLDAIVTEAGLRHFGSLQ
ncbi:MAG: 5-formyltetrahydrofolate cyclo-ligase [Cypionkella sp.]